jgi:hypothetical protein
VCLANGHWVAAAWLLSIPTRGRAVAPNLPTSITQGGEF